MRKLLLSLFVACLIFTCSFAHADEVKSYGCTALTGDVAGSLDNIDGSLLSDGYTATVRIITGTSTYAYFYVLDADSAAAESSPDIIKPDTNAGDKRWILAELRPIASTTVEGTIEIATDAEALAKTETDKAIVPSNIAGMFLDEDNMASDSATKICSQQSIKAYVDGTSLNSIIGDATAGRVFRVIVLNITDATVGDEIDVEGTGGWNATAIAKEEDLNVGEDTGNFNLDATASIITIEGAGLDGNAVAGISADVYTNASGTDLSVSVDASANNLLIYFRNSTSGAAVDLCTLVDTGAIYVRLAYITAS